MSETSTKVSSEEEEATSTQTGSKWNVGVLREKAQTRTGKFFVGATALVVLGVAGEACDGDGEDKPSDQFGNETVVDANDEPRTVSGESNESVSDLSYREVVTLGRIPPSLRQYSGEARAYMAEKIFEGRDARGEDEKLDYRVTTEGLHGGHQRITENEEGEPVVANFYNPSLAVVDDPSGERDGLLIWAAPHPETEEIITAPYGYTEEKTGELDEHERPFELKGEVHDDSRYFSLPGDGRLPQFVTFHPQSLGDTLESWNITGWIVRGSTQEDVECDDMTVEGYVEVYEGEDAVERARNDFAEEFDLREDKDSFFSDRKAADELENMEQATQCR